VKSLQEIIARLDGLGFRDDADREQAIAELRRLGPAQLRDALAGLLSADDPELRCQAALAAVLTGIPDAQTLILPLLEDASSTVRWHTCGLLYDHGDERAVEALVRRLESDTDPQVRVIAADALGEIGSPAAVPALKEAVARDHEVDQLGFTPSGSAQAALAAIESAAARRAD
jgi:HEAT repeat protein